MSGTFKIHDVPTGPVTVVVEALHHLPAEISFSAETDTSLTIDLAIDSVALRMTARQVKRLAERANAVMLSKQALTREDLRRSGAMTVYDYINRRIAPRRLPSPDSAPDVTCIFYDDVKVSPGLLVGLPSETVERIEIYGSGGDIIRVYTTRYAASLARTKTLARIFYMPGGRRTVCQ